MKKFALTLTLGLILLAMPALAGDHPSSHVDKHAEGHSGNHPMATKSGWFDLQNCEFCKNLTADPDLLPHLTWETIKTENGFAQISTCAPEFKDSYNKCNQAIAKLGNDMMTGKVNPMQVKMCGSCAGFGQFMMAGVKTENIHGEAADVMLVSSDDPAIVQKLHDYADRNNQEMAEMMASAHGK